MHAATWEKSHNLDKKPCRQNFFVRPLSYILIFLERPVISVAHFHVNDHTVSLFRQPIIKQFVMMHSISIMHSNEVSTFSGKEMTT